MMPLDLHYLARPDERFHLQTCEPQPRVWGSLRFIRRVSWDRVYNPDGSRGWFVSWSLCDRLQWYHGTAKADGTRTYMYRTGQLGEPYDTHSVVMTTTPTELRALRWRSRGMDPVPHWTNMGGA
jgi:hypothetical protein